MKSNVGSAVKVLAIVYGHIQVPSLQYNRDENPRAMVISSLCHSFATQEFFFWLRGNCFHFPLLTNMYDAHSDTRHYRCPGETTFCKYLHGTMLRGIVEELQAFDVHRSDVLRHATPSIVTLLVACKDPIFGHTQHSDWDSGHLNSQPIGVPCVKPTPLPGDIPCSTHVQFKKTGGGWAEGFVYERHVDKLCQVVTKHGRRLTVQLDRLYNYSLGFFSHVWIAHRGLYAWLDKRAEVKVEKHWSVASSRYSVAPAGFWSRRVVVEWSDMRSVLTAEQRHKQRALEAKFQKKNTSSALQLECPLRRTVDFHNCKAWPYGRSSTMNAIVGRFWTKLANGVQAHVEAVRSIDLWTTTSWGKVSKLLPVDENLRLLCETVDDLPQIGIMPKKTLAQHCSVQTEPEYLLDRICSLLDKCHSDLQNLSFSNEPKLVTANESDKIDFFTPILDKYQRVHDAVAAVGPHLPERFASKKVECKSAIIAAITTLAGIFNKANFPPSTDDQFDRVNSIIATLEVFTKICGPSLKDDASRIFTDLKDAIQQRYVRVALRVSACHLRHWTF